MMYRIAGMFGSKKVCRIVHDSPNLTSQILAHNWYVYRQNLSIRLTFLPATFTSAIRLTLAYQTFPLYGKI